MRNLNNYLRMPGPRVMYHPTYTPFATKAVGNFLAGEQNIQNQARQAELDNARAEQQQAANQARQRALDIEQQRSQATQEHYQRADTLAQHKEQQAENQRKMVFAAMNFINHYNDITPDNFVVYGKDMMQALGKSPEALVPGYAQHGVFRENGQINPAGVESWKKATLGEAEMIAAAAGYKTPKQTYNTYFNKSGQILNLPAGQNPPQGYYTKESFNALNQIPVKPAPETPFSVWRKNNPNAQIADWYKISKGTGPAKSNPIVLVDKNTGNVVVKDKKAGTAYGKNLTTPAIYTASLKGKDAEAAKRKLWGTGFIKIYGAIIASDYTNSIPPEEARKRARAITTAAFGNYGPKEKKSPFYNSFIKNAMDIERKIATDGGKLTPGSQKAIAEIYKIYRQHPELHKSPEVEALLSRWNKLLSARQQPSPAQQPQTASVVGQRPTGNVLSGIPDSPGILGTPAATAVPLTPEEAAAASRSENAAAFRNMAEHSWVPGTPGNVLLTPEEIAQRKRQNIGYQPNAFHF